MDTMENINNEIWRPIEGYDDYEVSNLGRVRRVIVINILKPDKSDGRRNRFCLYKNSKDKKREMGHILVAKAFPEICGEWFEGCEVHHKDKNSFNNNAENLVCLTKEQHTLEHIDELRERAKKILPMARTKKAIEKMKKTKSKPILQISKDGEIIKEWQSVTECERQIGYDKALVNRCCLGKQKTAYGYIWKYKEAS